MSIRILLADDHQVFREGLRSLIEKEDGMKVVAEAENGQTAVQLAEELDPDVVVMDVGMPNLNGFLATEQILSKDPEKKVIGLSVHSDQQFVANMFQAGAMGYMLKEGAFKELIAAIHAVMEGRMYVSPKVAGVVVESYLHPRTELDSGTSPALTTREREVLQLLAEGRSAKETAAILKIAVKTVETHRQKIKQKLNIHSIADLTRYAIRTGLVSVDK